MMDQRRIKIKKRKLNLKRRAMMSNKKLLAILKLKQELLQAINLTQSKITRTKVSCRMTMMTMKMKTKMETMRNSRKNL